MAPGRPDVTMAGLRMPVRPTSAGILLCFSMLAMLAAGGGVATAAKDDPKAAPKAATKARDRGRRGDARRTLARGQAGAAHHRQAGGATTTPGAARRGRRRRPRPHRHRRILRPPVRTQPRRRGGPVPGRARAGRRRRVPAPDAEDRLLHPARPRPADRLARPDLLLRRVGRLRPGAARRRRRGGAERASGNRQLRLARAGRRPLHRAGGTVRRPLHAGEQDRGRLHDVHRTRDGGAFARRAPEQGRRRDGARPAGERRLLLLGRRVQRRRPELPQLRQPARCDRPRHRVPVRARRKHVPAADAGGIRLVRAPRPGAHVSRSGDARRPALSRAAVDDRPAGAHVPAARARHPDRVRGRARDPVRDALRPARRRRSTSGSSSPKRT